MDNNISFKRKVKSGGLNIATYLSSFLTICLFLGIFIYCIITGGKSLNFNLFTSDYYETSYFATIEKNDTLTFDLKDTDDTFYSTSWGIGLKDGEDLEKNKCIYIAYIDDKSPLKAAKVEGKDELIVVEINQIIKRVQLTTAEGEDILLTSKSGAKTIAKELDKGIKINELYFATIGGGARGSLITTILLILITLVFSIPLGVFSALYLANYSKNNIFTKILRSLIDMISGVPSIVFGLAGAIIFVPFVSSISSGNGISILAGALTLTIMLLPIIIKNTEDAINTIPKSYKMASLSLGASETQTTFKIILPNSIPGILTSVLLSIGRIIGESAALIFVMGSAIQDNVSLFKGSTSLAVQIFSVLSGENPNYASACAISIIILIVVVLLNIIIKLISKRLNRFEVK